MCLELHPLHLLVRPSQQPQMCVEVEDIVSSALADYLNDLLPNCLFQKLTVVLFLRTLQTSGTATFDAIIMKGNRTFWQRSINFVSVCTTRRSWSHRYLRSSGERNYSPVYMLPMEELSCLQTVGFCACGPRASHEHIGTRSIGVQRAMTVQSLPWTSRPGKGAKTK